MTTQIKAGVIAANAVNSSELASGALSGQNFTGDVTFDTTTLHVDSTNNRVGIGTTSPSNLLHLTASNPAIYMETSGGGATDAAYIQKFSNDLYIYNKESAGKLLLGTNNATKATLDSSGNVGIGTTSPSSLNGFNKFIEIEGTSASLVLADNDATTWEIGSAGGNLKFFEGTDTFMTINTSGNVGIGTASPSYKLDLNGAMRINSSRSTFVDASEDSSAAAHIFVTNDGVGDFSQEAGHLIIQARTHTSVYRDIIFAGGINNASDLMRITGEGKVGIGTSSPSRNLTVQTSDQTDIAIIAANNQNSILNFGDTDDDNVGRIQYNHSTNLMTFRTNTADAMHIDSSGDLTVGTSSLGFHFDVSTQLFSTTFGTGGNLTLAVTNSSGTGNGGEIFLGGSSRGDSLRNVISFRNGSNTERMRINQNGTLMVGTTTNATYVHKAHFSGNANIDGVVRIEDVDGTVALSNAILGLAYPNDSDATNGYFIYMTDGNGAIGSIQAASGTSVSFNTTSDERLKKNIVNASPQLDIIKSVKVREFDWKRNDHHELGLIAQEIKDIIPNVVSEGGDDETKNPYGVDYGKLTPYLIKAIQEQQTIIDDLKSRIETLEG